jgi:hypothetical protein
MVESASMQPTLVMDACARSPRSLLHPKRHKMPTLTVPGNSKYSWALGIRSPVPMRVIGTTGTCRLGMHTCHYYLARLR